MSLPLTWQELTERNIKTMRSIFRGTGLNKTDRLVACAFAYNMIKGIKFDQDTASGRWNVLHNALRIVVVGIQIDDDEVLPSTPVTTAVVNDLEIIDYTNETEEEQILRYAAAKQARRNKQQEEEDKLVDVSD